MRMRSAIAGSTVSGRDEDGAAVVAVLDGPVGCALDALRLGRGDRQVAALARRADEAGDARALGEHPAALVLLQQLVGDAGGELLPCGELDAGLALHLRLHRREGAAR